ncbi:MAG: ABC transporter substrate-binding protein, partial [Eubacteriales bacterium]
MKKLLATLLAVAMMATAFAGCASSTTSTASTTTESTESTAAAETETAEVAEEAPAGDNTVVIGIYEPASGDNGAGGKQEMLGMQYAYAMNPTVDIDGVTYNVVLEYADNQSSTDKAVSAASQLVSAGSSVVLGSYGSGVAIAGSDTFAAAGVPAIGVTCTNSQVTEGNSHYFRICFIDPFQGTVLANFAQDKFEAKTAYVLTKLGDDYSTGLGYYFEEAFEAAGGTVISEAFPDG